MTAYYNEIDPYCAEWLRNLIAAGHLPAGDVDERPIEEVFPDDVRPYTQCHFFAGIGGWPLAARLAGWPDERPIWTGSCPCQPFSNAGKRLAYDDPRNLWPHFARLIQDCRPPVVAGEQVASKAGRLWLAGVRADLEALGYGVGAADLCAAGVGAPHIRQRLWWVADAERAAIRERGSDPSDAEAVSTEVREQWLRPDAESDGGDGRRVSGGLGHALEPRLEGHAGHGDHRHEPGRHDADAGGSVAPAGGDCGLSDANRAGPLSGAQTGICGPQESGGPRHVEFERSGGQWDDATWTPCADGKARRIEPGIEPLAHGVPARVGKLRAYGNAIVPWEGAEVIAAYLGL